MMTRSYRVRAGQVLAHDGLELPPGTIVELPPHVAADLPHLVEPVDADGAPLLPPSSLEADLARARPHERVSLLQNERARVAARGVPSDAARLAELDAAIAKEQAPAGSPARPHKKSASPDAASPATTDPGKGTD